jgi:hypothetical protein
LCPNDYIFAERNIWFREKKLEAKHLLIPYHQDANSSADFFLFYDSIDDSIVLVNKREGLFKCFSQGGAKVLPESDLYVTPKQFLSSLKLLISMASRIRRDYWSPLLIAGLLKYMKHSARIQAYYNSVNVKHVGVVRGDMCPESSLLRNISASKGVTTYAWSHSVWWYRELVFLFH